MSSEFQNNSIFWVEVDKIKPNPFQPRREFDPERLNDLAESIRQYGVLQPLTVTRREKFHEGEGMTVEYELIAGERRHRAAKIANLKTVPVIIRTGGEKDDRIKLELAIIENLQREDLNPIERARAFAQLANEFGFKHVEIAKKIGKSREYVSNSIRLLGLPEEMQQKVIEGRLTEGHARPLLMLNDRPEEQQALFKEMIYKKLTVRESETIARKVAVDKVRKKTMDVDPELIELEKRLSESFGTRVHIEKKEVGGKIVIDFFSDDDIKGILGILSESIPDVERGSDALLKKYIARTKERVASETGSEEVSVHPRDEEGEEKGGMPQKEGQKEKQITLEEKDDYSKKYVEDVKEETSLHDEEDEGDVQEEEEKTAAGIAAFTQRPRTADTEDDDLYSINNFSI